jgi:hypothetical protein
MVVKAAVLISVHRVRLPIEILAIGLVAIASRFGLARGTL